MKWSNLKKGDVLHWPHAYPTSYVLLEDPVVEGDVVVSRLLRLDTGRLYASRHPDDDPGLAGYTFDLAGK